VVQLKISHNFPEVQRWLDDVGKQARYAAMKALNETAKDVQAGIKTEIRHVFDRPTSYIVNSIRITAWAKRDKLEAVIEPKYMGGKGVEPTKVLQAEIVGGPRRLKKSEVALRRVGILPPGYVTVPGEAAPLDGFGNIKGSFIVQLLSYFQAFGEQGYKANMTDRRKAQLAKRGVNANGYRKIGGVEYFVSYGKLRGGQTSHLHPGIWARSGTHGAVVKPILMFVRQANYKPRLDVFGVSRRIVDKVFPRHFEREFAIALRTAK
jgi:hypothetical protein